MKPTTKQRTATKPIRDEAPTVVSRKAKVQCVICGSDAAPFSEEKLCWVCRRLKVSAWGEGTDTQMFAAE
jgi:hypothetical protein